ncbi:MAG: methyltransferase domain-containing protein [Planctomycetes bacterium]|nr:methyltransferase domain-containing protein [Planctomycetota bacterium]MBI3848487.1 methyltransferase domain-containing protein [Planctomycetota bacterium]
MGSKPATRKRTVSPKRILQTSRSYIESQILLAGASLDVFGLIHGGARTAAAVARRAGADSRAMEMLLDALVAYGFLKKSHAGYANTPESETYLVPTSSLSLVDSLRISERLYSSWAQLADAVRTGHSVRRPMFVAGHEQAFVEGFARGMRAIARLVAPALVRAVDLRDARRLLDVGAGPGTLAVAFLRRYPRLEATLFDYPWTLAVAKTLVAEDGVSSRVSFVGGDFEKDALPSGFDVVLASQILHGIAEPALRSLMSRMRGALVPGGRLLIREFRLDRSRTKPAYGAAFSLNMLLGTDAGRAYTVDEYVAFARDAAFATARPLAVKGLPPEQVVIEARVPR